MLTKQGQALIFRGVPLCTATNRPRTRPRPRTRNRCRRFTGAVLADQDVDCARIDGEIHLVEGHGPRETLGDLLRDHNDLMRFRTDLLHLIRGLHVEIT